MIQTSSFAWPATPAATRASPQERFAEAPGPAADDAARAEVVRSSATRFEAVFLAEMLKHTGLARTPDAFGGGAGEAQFAPMLVRAYADALADRGGIGLADQVADAMLRRLS